MDVSRIARSFARMLCGLLLWSTHIFQPNCAAIFAADTDSLGQWVVVAPAEFDDAIGPLAAYRREQGWRVTRVFPTANGTIERVRHAVEAFHGRTVVLLVGAWDGTKQQPVVPAGRGRYGRMAEQFTDIQYGLPNERAAVAIAVGRLPARTLDEATKMIQKLRRFESTEVGPWRNQINLFVGHPGGRSEFERKFASGIVESALATRVKKLHPRWRPTCLSDADNSRFAVGSREFGRSVEKVLKQGQFAALYCGHSGPDGLYSTRGRVLGRQAFADIDVGSGAGVLVSCGCWGCQTDDARGPGYAVAAIRNMNGPAAVVGAFGESYAAHGQLAMDGFVECLSRNDPPRLLADYWMAAQHGITQGSISPAEFLLYDNADGTAGRVPLEQQRLEHAEMWTLLGDPAMRMPIVQETIRVQSTRQETNGMLTVSMKFPQSAIGQSAEITVEDRIQAWHVPQPDAEPVLNHHASQRVVVKEPMMAVELPVPSNRSLSELIVRVHVRPKNGDPLIGQSLIDPPNKS